MATDEGVIALAKNNEAPIYEPSEKERFVVRDIFLKFREAADSRDRNFQYFDGLNLIDYIEDSVRRFVTNVDERDEIEDWQARVHDPFTRNKVLAILGKVVSVLPIANFVGRGDEDTRKGLIITNLYEYSEELDDYEELMIHVLLEAIVKGTAIAYEGIEKKNIKRRDVNGVDDDITISEEDEVTTSLYGAIVPLEEFYPSSVSIRNIRRMPNCFWRKVIPFSKFQADWGMFSKASKVQEKRVFADGEKKPFYADFISSDVREGEVEIIRLYDKENDEYIVLANGVWLNPINGKDGGELISPLPWNHKELPFWDVKFDFFGDFFYGKSLPDRLKSMQDVLNVLTNMLLDQSFMTIFPPLLTSGFDSIEDDYLRPGRRTPVDTQGLPLNQSFMKLDLGAPQGWHQFILEYTRKIMEQSSVDQVSQGIAGVGERTTAREITVAAEGVTSLLGLFARMVNYGIKRKAKLRASNIMQFWTDEGSPFVQRSLGSDGGKQMEKAFNVFKIDNTVLSDGKRGTKIIEMYANSEQLPTAVELEARAKVAEADTGKKIEYLAILPEYVREFQFDVKIIANPKNDVSKEIEKSIQLEKVRVYMSFFPQLVDIRELAAQTMEKMGDDPAKLLKEDVLNPVPEAARGEMANTMGMMPEGNTAENMVRGARSGEQGLSELANIQNNLTR